MTSFALKQTATGFEKRLNIFFGGGGEGRDKLLFNKPLTYRIKSHPFFKKDI